MPTQTISQFCNKLYKSADIQSQIHDTWETIGAPNYISIRGKQPTKTYYKDYIRHVRREFLQKCKNQYLNRVQIAGASRHRKSRRKRNKSKTVRRR